jgi:hypothetical protein
LPDDFDRVGKGGADDGAEGFVAVFEGRKVNIWGGERGKREDEQSFNVRDGRVGNLAAFAKLRSELDREEVGEFVLEDGRANGDTEDLTEATDKTVEGHLRERERGRVRKEGGERREERTYSVAMLSRVERRKDGEVGSGIEKTGANGSDDAAVATRTGQRKKERRGKEKRTNKDAHIATLEFHFRIDINPSPTMRNAHPRWF